MIGSKWWKTWYQSWGLYIRNGFPRLLVTEQREMSPNLDVYWLFTYGAVMEEWPENRSARSRGLRIKCSLKPQSSENSILVSQSKATEYVNKRKKRKRKKETPPFERIFHGRELRILKLAELNVDKVKQDYKKLEDLSHWDGLIAISVWFENSFQNFEVRWKQTMFFNPSQYVSANKSSWKSYRLMTHYHVEHVWYCRKSIASRIMLIYRSMQTLKGICYAILNFSVL